MSAKWTQNLFVKVTYARYVVLSWMYAASAHRLVSCPNCICRKGRRKEIAMRRRRESQPRTWQWIRNRSGRTTRQGGTQDLEKVSKKGRRGGDGAPQKIRKHDQPQFRLRLYRLLYLLGQLSVRPRLMAVCWAHIELNPSSAWSLNQKERLSELRQARIVRRRKEMSELEVVAHVV